MSYSILPTHRFAKELKRLVKKFPSLKKEYSELISAIVNNPDTGTFVGNNCYKIRIAIESKGKGKSGGQELLLICMLKQKQFIYLPFMIKVKKKT